MAGYVESDRSVLWTLNGDVAATERELQYTSEVLGLKYDKPQAADSTPKPQLKPKPVQKEVADIAL